MKRLLSHPTVFWAFVTVALFAWLGTRGLNEPDEGRYAEVGREMAASGDWLMPRLNGFEHLQKPPLIYWATALSFRLFGVDEWAARLACALPALGTLYLTWLLSATLFGRDNRVMAPLILLSSCEFLLMSRALTPDMMLTFWITLAIACLVKHVPGGRREAWRVGFFASMGLGFLCKGPMALVVPISAALCWQLALLRRGEDVRLGWRSGLPISLGIGLSWFAVVALHHPRLVDYFWRYELRDRVFSSVHGRSQPFWFFVPVLLGGMMPWTPALIAVAVRGWRALRAREDVPPAMWLLAGWIVPPFAILSLSGSKLPTYILPLLPAFALVVARWCEAHSGSAAFRRVVTWSIAGMLALSVALPFVALGMRWFAPLYRDVWFSPGFTVLLLALISGFALLLRRPPTPNAVLALGCGATLLWVGLVTQADRLLVEEGGSIRPLARIVERLPGADSAEIFAYGVRANGMAFYLQRLISRSRKQSAIVLPVQDDQKARVIDSIETYLDGLGTRPAVGIVSPKSLTPDGVWAGWRVLGRSGRYVLIANDAAAAGPEAATSRSGGDG